MQGKLFQERLREEVEEQKKALGRDPKVLIVAHNRVAGLAREILFDGLVMEDPHQQSLELVMNEQTQRAEIVVNQLPMSDLSNRAIYSAVERIYYLVETEKARLVTPNKRLVIP